MQSLLRYAILDRALALLAAMLFVLLGNAPAQESLWTERQIRTGDATTIPCWWGQNLGPSDDAPRRVVILATSLPSGTEATNPPAILKPWEPMIREGLIVVQRKVSAASLFPSDWPQFLRALRVSIPVLEGRFELLVSDDTAAEVLDHIDANPFDYRFVQLRITKPVHFSRSPSARAHFTTISFLSEKTDGGLGPAFPAGAEASALGFQVMASAAPLEHPSAAFARYSNPKREGLDSQRSAHRLLHDLHDAATRAHYERYFDCFSKDAVFLGTDASERWTKSEFQSWAHPHFQRDSAWIFTVLDRKLHATADGATLWFEESLGSRSYGECRGTGVILTEKNGTHRIAQYNLTVPIPNDLLPAIADRISRLDGQKPMQRTYWISRHAEKEQGRDPQLSAAGKDRAARLAAHLRFVTLDAVYSTEWKRTRETADAVATRMNKATVVMEAGAPEKLLEAINKSNAHQVLIVGHSNTVPDLIRRLGIKDPPTLSEEDYGDLFQVIVTPEGSQLTRIRL